MNLSRETTLKLTVQTEIRRDKSHAFQRVRSCAIIAPQSRSLTLHSLRARRRGVRGVRGGRGARGGMHGTRAARATRPGHWRRRPARAPPHPSPRIPRRAHRPTILGAPESARSHPSRESYICTVVTLKFNFRLSGLRRGGSNEFRTRVPVSYLNNENRNFCRGHENYSIRRGFPLLSSDNYFGNLLICHRFYDSDY